MVTDSPASILACDRLCTSIVSFHALTHLNILTRISLLVDFQKFMKFHVKGDVYLIALLRRKIHTGLVWSVNTDYRFFT